MSSVSAFVHLYHVWGVFGLITAIIYGRSAYQCWREDGGTFGNAPREIGGAGKHAAVETVRDWGRFVRWFFAGLTGIAYHWPETSRKRVYSRDLTLLLGITLGGVSRAFTAAYWAEANTAWMTEATVWVPSIPIIAAIWADSKHQVTAWPDKPWRARLILSVAVVWIIAGSALR
ncbi:MAG: hypothetical protein AAFW97_14510 [Pseudomonadota bacterium]